MAHTHSGPAKVHRGVTTRDDQAGSDVAQSAIESIESQLETVKKYLYKAEIAKANSLLSSSRSNFIDWNDLLAILPPLHEMNHIINCYFSDASVLEDEAAYLLT